MSRLAKSSSAAASMLLHRGSGGSQTKATPTVSVHRTVESIRSVRRALLLDNTKKTRTTVGFVPTMGALHEGHLSLVRQAKIDNDIVIASIFVNPTQFAPGEDLDKYPRQLEYDTKLLSELGVDHLFAPEAASMYGPNHVTYVDPQGFDDAAEGKSRPGHFRGVATIVTKLFHIVEPDTAYFGQKDAAQCVMIKRLVEDLDMGINIQVQDTIREADGLAMSSRNAYLTPTERTAAPVVYRSLQAARSLFASSKEGPISSTELRNAVQCTLQSEPLVSEIQYVSVDSRETMRPLEQVEKDSGAIVSLACKVGKVRLIDNLVLK